MKKVAKELIGMSFSRLTVLSRKENTPSNQTRWECKCICGNVKTVIGYQLTSGKTKSCGCIHKEQLSKRVRKHGLTGTKEWWIWHKMKDRCNKPRDKGWSLYGARGIKVCARWESDFLTFLADMGPRPSPNHSIERRNNNGNYEPDNCYWATDFEQAANKRNNVYLTFNNETYHLSEWARKIGLKVDQLKYLIRRKKLSLESVIRNKAPHLVGLAIETGCKDDQAPEA